MIGGREKAQSHVAPPQSQDYAPPSASYCFTTHAKGGQDSRSHGRQEAFRNQLIQHNVQALSYVKSDKFIVRVEDDWQQTKSKDNWEEWTSSFSFGSHHRRVMLWLYIVQAHSACHSRPAENKDGFCKTCPMQCVEGAEDELPDSITPHQQQPTPSTPLTPPASLISMDTVAASVTSINARTTGFESAPLARSVVRVRRRGPLPGDQRPSSSAASPDTASQPDLDAHNHEDEHSFPPSPQPDPRDHQRHTPWLTASNMKRRLARVCNYLGTAYIFRIARPLIIDEGDDWSEPRLKRHVNALKIYVLPTNIAFSDVAGSPIPRSLVMLSAIFALFGTGSTLYLHLKIGDPEVFSTWFLVISTRDSVEFGICYEDSCRNSRRDPTMQDQQRGDRGGSEARRRPVDTDKRILARAGRRAALIPEEIRCVTATAGAGVHIRGDGVAAAQRRYKGKNRACVSNERIPMYDKISIQYWDLSGDVASSEELGEVKPRGTENNVPHEWSHSNPRNPTLQSEEGWRRAMKSGATYTIGVGVVALRPLSTEVASSRQCAIGSQDDSAFEAGPRQITGMETLGLPPGSSTAPVNPVPVFSEFPPLAPNRLGSDAPETPKDLGSHSPSPINAAMVQRHSGNAGEIRTPNFALSTNKWEP
ncbi:hypothetical protein B0H14DRAFT_3163173 [Mycena olivaceomarginata]|nr:hypothetical protein B0H14DRAFT_3163173 [Mycena olivaceomarginata]